MIALFISLMVSSLGLLMGLAALILVGYGVLVCANLIMIFSADETVEISNKPKAEEPIILHSEDSLFGVKDKL